MKYKILIYCACLVLMFSLNGCSRENTEQIDLDKITITQHDPSGNLIAEGEMSKTTGKGVFKFYFPDGTLRKVQEVINDSIEHGTYKYYYSSGVLKDSAQLTYGKFHGNRYMYYQSGVLHEKTKYINNKVRDEIRYDSTGVVEEYWAGNYGEILNFVTYYEKGKYERTKGNLINSGVLEESYPINEPFSIEILVGQPPMFETNVWVGYKNKSDSEFTELFSGKPDRFNRVSYSLTQNSNDDVEIINTAKAVNKNIVISDTLLIVIDKDGQSSYNYLGNSRDKNE